MKRPISLVSLILSIVFSAFFSIGLTVLLFQVDYEIPATKRVVVYIIISLILLITLFSAVISAFSLKFCNKTHEIYKNNEKFFNLSLSFDFIVATGGIIMALMGFSSWLVLFVLEAIAGVVNGILLVVDIALENRRISLNEEKQEDVRNIVKSTKISAIENSAIKNATIKNSETINSSLNNSAMNNSAKHIAVKTNTLEAKLKRLQEMREKGLINEEEYQNLRQKRISEVRGSEPKQPPLKNNSLQMQLKVLEGMKEDKVISEEDYQKLKLSLIKENLK